MKQHSLEIDLYLEANSESHSLETATPHVEPIHLVVAPQETPAERLQRYWTTDFFGLRNVDPIIVDQWLREPLTLRQIYISPEGQSSIPTQSLSGGKSRISQCRRPLTTTQRMRARVDCSVAGMCYAGMGGSCSGCFGDGVKSSSVNKWGGVLLLLSVVEKDEELRNYYVLPWHSSGTSGTWVASGDTSVGTSGGLGGEANEFSSNIYCVVRAVLEMGIELPYHCWCCGVRISSKLLPDPSYEKWETGFYVPREEAFSEVKQLTFSTNFMYSMLTALIPSLEATILDPDLGFPNFNAIDELYTQGLNLPALDKQEVWKSVIPRLIKTVSDEAHSILRFKAPETLDRDKFFWLRDEEFSRQTLAGLDTLSIKLVTEWPLKSNLDPEIYGPAEPQSPPTLFNEKSMKHNMVFFLQFPFMQAIDQKRLFILDYHDLFLPYVERVRDLKGRALYGSRTMFFLNPDETLKPIAIELTRPPMDGKPQWKEVYTSCLHSTGDWLWKLAKTQVLSQDSIYHQLVSHWLRTHACSEPYVIATNRGLSVMHPIYRLLHPHLQYTMEINALARESLVSADGLIEKIMTFGKYYLEVGSIFYDQHWQFDQQSLPADLISRGMAVEDPNAPQGLRLTIKDYPYASDGLLLWDALKQWVTEYVNHYYPKPSMVEADQEIQSWWTEIRTIGHGQHAAVNFGQYTYAGYFPSRPSFTRTKMPNEDPTDNEWRRFLRKPEAALLECLPSQIQATRAMAIWNVISHHSPDEEYVGDKLEPSWVEDPVIRAAFERLHGKLKQVEGIIDERNADCNLKNRNGAGITPYELFKPFSEPGVTGMGVPNSVSI
ncbi:Linoleate 13S-lipoxygenase 2-1 [Hibiscus syriacus]|uniref:Lipoxygenase n=1 Tax=Hibiscus syriacus TaxID=106335 RepID=A0A6A2YJL2_HIBSY|nr:Linoleate 13S-lipoxygenase 2-1 [Hibiscus syriacus]